MERGFAQYIIVGIMVAAWIGTHVLKNKVHRAGAWFVALLMAFFVNLLSAFRAGSGGFSVWFFATLIGAIGTGIYFVRVWTSTASLGDELSADSPLGDRPEQLCVNCVHSEPRDSEKTLWCAAQQRAVPSHYTCARFGEVGGASAAP